MKMLPLILRDSAVSKATDLRMLPQYAKQRCRATAVKATKENKIVMRYASHGKAKLNRPLDGVKASAKDSVSGDHFSHLVNIASEAASLDSH